MLPEQARGAGLGCWILVAGSGEIPARVAVVRAGAAQAVRSGHGHPPP